MCYISDSSFLRKFQLILISLLCYTFKKVGRSIYQKGSSVNFAKPLQNKVNKSSKKANLGYILMAVSTVFLITKYLIHQQESLVKLHKFRLKKGHAILV